MKPPPRPVGEVTRGTTAPNRLRRVDRWLAFTCGAALRRAADPLVVDLGFGASPITSVELWHRLRAVRPDLELIGLEIDATRVAAAQRYATPPPRPHTVPPAAPHPLSTEPHTPPTRSQAQPVTVTPRARPAVRQAPLAEPNTLPSEPRAVPAVRHGPPGESHGVPGESHGLAAESHGLPAASGQGRGRLAFRRGGFELPIEGGRRPVVVRAFNVLRQYAEADVAGAWQMLCGRLAADGLLIEGTCDEIGRHATWVALGPEGPRTLTLAVRIANLRSPSELAERLPKALIHRNVPGERVHDWFADLDRAWAAAAPFGAFGVRQRWIATVATVARDWPVLHGRQRWRLGEVTVAWEAVAPR